MFTNGTNRSETPPAGEMLHSSEAMEPHWIQHVAGQLSGPERLQLLGEVAHDGRSSLTAILFLAETLQRRLSGDINGLQYRQLGLIYSAALGLSQTVSNLLELIRGGNGLAEERSPFSVSDTLESVSDIARPMAEEKGLVIRPSAPSVDHRLGHPLALSRVLLNLTTTALLTAETGVVELAAKETGRTHIEFSVHHTGTGIGTEPLETLFAPFPRTAHGQGYRFSSTGLDLVLCRRLVEAMGSQFHVESKPHLGTRFSFGVELEPGTEL